MGTTARDTNADYTYIKLGGTTVDAGSYVVVATVSYWSYDSDSDHNGKVTCQLRNDTTAPLDGADGAWIGGLTSSVPEAINGSHDGHGDLALHGGAYIAAGTGEISLWCTKDQTNYVAFDPGLVVVLRIGGFF